jgi:hypothetical protein
MTTAMMEGMPKTNAPTIVAALRMPMIRLRVCSAYTRCATLTSDGAGAVETATLSSMRVGF